MRSAIGFLAVLAAAAVVLSGCPDPVSSPVSRYGQVRVDFSVGSRAAGSIPANVASIAILVRGSGMADVEASLTAPKLSTVLEIPAGKNREFTVTAKDSAGSVVFLGKSTMDIKAGADHELAVAMKTMSSLSFNANGGSGTPPATIYNEPGAQVTIPTTAGTLSLAGYFIELWNTAADGSGTDYLPGQSIAMPAVGTTLYAQWALSNYTITYHLNGGTSHSNPTSYTILSSTIGLTAPVWAGHTFEGWHDSPALDSPVSFIPAGSTGDRNLYAKWAVPTYYITFDAGGGTGTMSAQGIPEGSTAPLTTNTFSRPGYSFAGWGTSLVGPVAYGDGDPYTMGGANVTLYAQWSANDYTVTYDAQGGSPAIPASEVVTFGANYPTPPGTTRLGYTFGGWWTAIGGTGTQVTGATTMTTPSDHTLYAFWTADNFQVIFDKNAPMATGSMAPQVIAFDASATLFSNSFTYPGYAFAGWGTSPGGPVVYGNGATFTMTTPGVTLYAQWTINNYSLSYSANGATLGTVPTTQNGNFNTVLTVAANTGNLYGPILQDGIRQRFTGWNTASNGSGTNYLPGENFIIPAANTTLYAQYTTDASVIGKIGPAGGFVFHDKGSVTDGWRYMEAAPVNQTNSIWRNAPDQLIGAAATGIGSGAFNSLAIIHEPGHTSSAALVCDTYSVVFDGITYDDWFLPSKDEINAAHANLSAADIAESAYWSSSETGTNGAYCPSEATPTHNTLKEYSYPVRAVRTFSGAAKTFVIQYMSTGADSGAPIQDPTHYAPGAGITINGAGTMIKSTYDFGGWNTEADGSGTTYMEGSSTMPAGNLVLYPIWNPV